MKSVWKGTGASHGVVHITSADCDLQSISEVHVGQSWTEVEFYVCSGLLSRWGPHEILSQTKFHRLLTSVQVYSKCCETNFYIHYHYFAIFLLKMHQAGWNPGHSSAKLLVTRCEHLQTDGSLTSMTVASSFCKWASSPCSQALGEAHSKAQ